MSTTDPDERGPVGAVARLVLVQLLAVVAIASAITALAVLVGPDDSTVTAGPGSGRPPGATVSTPTSTTETPAPTAAGSSSPGTTAPSAPASTAPSPTSPTATGSEQPQVDVLNQDAADGAASEVADQLRAVGWRIGRVDDFSGTVRTTTIYYPSGMRREARALARDLPGSQRLLDRLSTLSPTRLSVVLVGEED